MSSRIIRTPTYNFKYLKRGSFYSAKHDFRKFTTLDYNLKSYIGIIGNGIISGWELISLDGLNVQILHGKGIINGFAVESPFTVKKRSEMVNGDREIEVFDQNGTTPEDLTPSERTQYINVIKLYNPSFAPPSDIPNYFVKTVIPAILTIDDNTDNYLIAKLPTNHTPYPKLTDLESLISSLGNPPQRNDYNNYSDYKTALDTYNSQLKIIRNYQWYNNSNNHFTAVEFKSSTSKIFTSSEILIGKVITRNGFVWKVDTSNVNYLENLSNEIHQFAKLYLTNHHHGGARTYDPPKIRLETDIRNCIQYKYNESTGSSFYKVLESVETTTNLGHSHRYEIDSDGNGYTLETIGVGITPHFHKIVNFIVQEQQKSSQFIKNHIHDINSSDSNEFSWDVTDRFIIYLNGDEFANQESDKVNVYPERKMIEIKQGISSSLNTYSTSFRVFNKNYNFTTKANTVYQFMIKLMSDFYAKYNNKFRQLYDTVYEQKPGYEYYQPNDDPFYFWSNPPQENEVELFTVEQPDGIPLSISIVSIGRSGNTGISGLGELRTQSLIAQSLLKEVGDTFLFVPNAANNILIKLEDAASQDRKDSVQIEILGNAEVTGKLKSDNIFYVNADKILKGIFQIEKIPFISHVGRLFEECFPCEYPLLSKDGFRYSITPAITDYSFGHYHKTYLNQEGTGFTTDTMVGDEVVYYQTGENNDSIFIAHNHAINWLEVSEAGSEGVATWQDLSDGKHTHNVISPLKGNGKIVYSIEEDIFGNLFVGTSDGFIMIPFEPAYLFVINGYNYYEFGSDLWSLFIDAKNLYEVESNISFPLEEGVYRSQINQAEKNLNLDGDSVLVYGSEISNKVRDKVLIKKINYFHVPNFKYETEKDPQNVLSNEEIIGTKFVSVETGEEIDWNNRSDEDEEVNPIKMVNIVKRDFNYTPIWSIASRTVTISDQNYIPSSSQIDLLVVGSDIISKNFNLQNNVNKNWQYIEVPLNVGIIRKLICTSDNSYWMITNNGILVSRPYMEGDYFLKSNLPGANPNIKDIIESTPYNIMVISDAGVFKTENFGKTWIKKLDNIDGFDKISRDYSLDVSDVVDKHYHKLSVNKSGNGFLSESIGEGIKHVHQVDSWKVLKTLKHNHSLMSTIYVKDNNNVLWKSIDNGEVWLEFGKVPLGETGEIIAAFDKIFVAKEDGLYSSSNGSEWSKVIDSKCYSFSWDYNLQSVFVGGNNIIYRTYNGNSFEVSNMFDGNPTSVLVKGNDKINFGYAYSNGFGTFHFKGYRFLDDNYKALVDFNKWFASNGTWDEKVPYDIYIDNKLILSTKHNIDRRLQRGYDFDVLSSNGVIDFSAFSKINENVFFGDSMIEVESIDGFSVGDLVLIGNYVGIAPVPLKDDMVNEFSKAATKKKYYALLNQYYNQLSFLKQNFTFGIIKSLKHNCIELTSKIDKNIEFNIETLFEGIIESLKYTDETFKLDENIESNITMLFKNVRPMIYKISDFDNNSNIIISIYQSLLSNIGDLTHDEVEDKLSLYSDVKPYKLNDTYLSNLIQLTQAVRYIYPDINSRFINDVFYDFRYKSPLNPSYPDITEFIDVLTSEMYSQKFFDSNFHKFFAKSINKILIGYGKFSGNIIVATDIGLFWAKIVPNMESNWFYVKEAPYPAYDVLIVEDKILAGTGNGLFSSRDMNNWALESSLFSGVPIYSLELRWKSNDNDIVVVPDHQASFLSTEDGKGRITASSGTPYKILQIGQGIKITNAQEKDGIYIIENINDLGDGYGSQIIVSKPFIGPDVIKDNVVMTMSEWWEMWDGVENLSNTNLKNTILLGSESKVFYSINMENSNFSWAESNIDVSNFIAKSFTSLSNGSILLMADGARDNYVLESQNIGNFWDVFKTIDLVEATIDNVEISDSNNTILTVSYTKPDDYKNIDGFLAGRSVTIFDEFYNSIFSTTVIWNEIKNNKNLIKVFGIASIDYRQMENVRVEPLKINNALETSDGTVFFGCDQGIYSDNNTAIVKDSKLNGTIRNIGYNGVIDSIDLSGFIVSQFISNTTGNTVFSINLNTKIRANELFNKKLYITDTWPVEEYNIIENRSINVGGEVTVEIDASITDNYKDKKVKIVGANSRVNVDFELSVQNGQFDGGTMYIVSDSTDSISKTYKIKHNTDSYLDLEEVIIPFSTFDNESVEVPQPLEGRNISLIDSDKNLILWISLNRQIRRYNSMRGLKIKTQEKLLSDLVINSNTYNSFVIKIDETRQFWDEANRQVITKSPDQQIYQIIQSISAVKGDYFELNGLIFEPLYGFDNKKTSLNSDHKHNVRMINDVVTGKIKSFISHNESFVTIEVEDTYNFSNSLVQFRKDLFKNAKILFINDESYNLGYISDVISHTSNSITIRLKSESFWNFDNADNENVSVGWEWRIDAYNYGYTYDIEYDDFIVKQTFITQEINRGDTIVYLEDTYGIEVGDKIKIQDDTLSFEFNIINQVIDDATISVETPFLRTFYLNKNPQIKILRNSFENIHVHQIRNNEVELLNISSYLNNGYPSEHSHLIRPLLLEINQMIYRDGEIIVVGSDKRIYSSIDNGITWQEIANLDNFKEKDTEINSIFSVTLKDNGIIVGSNNGRLFVEGMPDENIIKLKRPRIN